MAGPAFAADADADAGAEALDFARLPERRLACLRLSVREAAARLGPAQHRFDSTLQLDMEGGRSWSQAERSELTWDDAGGLWLKRSAGPNDFEAGRVGNQLYVALERGQLRRKGPGDMPLEPLADQLLGSLGQAVLFFGPLTFTPTEAPQHEGRAVHAFRLEVADAADAPTPGLHAAWAATARGNQAPAPVWRQQLRSRRVAGRMLVDQKTCLVLSAELEGEGQLVHLNAPATRVRARIAHRVHHIGQTPRVVARASVPEFHRRPRPLDPLAFFRGREASAER